MPALRKALAKETKNAAVLIIAQRVSTIRHADQIIVLHEGRMAGKGTHDRLWKPVRYIGRFMNLRQRRRRRMNPGTDRRKEKPVIIRLFGQLEGQKVRLGIVGCSILIYTILNIWNPLYSARVIDHLWESIQGAWKEGIPFSITWTNMGMELTRLTEPSTCWPGSFISSSLI